MATVTTNCMATNADWQRTLVADLLRLNVFKGAPEEELACFAAEATEEHVAEGTQLLDEHDQMDAFLVLLEGRVSVSRTDRKGQELFRKKADAPSFMGELHLISTAPSEMTVVALAPLRIARLTAQSFWNVMARCPSIRLAVLEEMAFRRNGLKGLEVQQEKMAMLGTMTAGLMHELNNPGSAARRAASQLRANFQHMHLLARTFSEKGHTPDQRACLTRLQERVLAVSADVCMGSLEQSDAEEEMAEWMSAHGLGDNAWTYAPVLVASGIHPGDLDCLAAVFPSDDLADPIDWLESTASSMQMVGLVEESVTRVTELAQAVKTYAHEGQNGSQDVDVNESVHATLVMMKHKLREKNLTLDKHFGGGIPKLHCVCSGLNQVWTNLLDNAIDAAPIGGVIGIRTSLAGDEVQVVVHDNGPGISPEVQERIFEMFFTTKPAGVGTGLGLGIVQRLLQTYEGRLTLQSTPGSTEFTVHLPLHNN